MQESSIISPFKNNLHKIIEKILSLCLIDKEEILDLKIMSMIEKRKGNYFLYEEILNNIKILSEPVIDFKEELVDRTTQILKDINENFILDSIQNELDEVLNSTLNTEYMKKGIFESRLIELNKSISSIEKIVSADHYNGRKSDQINFQMTSNAIKLLEILVEMNDLIKNKLKKKCKKCGKY